jgi:hypothetical protein
MTMSEHWMILTGVPRGWADVADAAVQMLVVVPADEAYYPL